MFDIFRLFWCCTCPNCFLPSIIKKEKNKINESTFIFNRFNYLEMLIKLGATKFQLVTMLINQTKACIIRVGSRNKFVLGSLWIAYVTQNRNYLAEIYLSPILTPTYLPWVDKIGHFDYFLPFNIVIKCPIITPLSMKMNWDSQLVSAASQIISEGCEGFVINKGFFW